MEEICECSSAHISITDHVHTLAIDLLIILDFHFAPSTFKYYRSL